MTLILAMATTDANLIAADSSSIWGWAKAPRKDPKITAFEHGALAIQGSFRLQQLAILALEEMLNKPDGPKNWRWAIREAIPALRAELSGGGFMKKKDEREQSEHFLVATRDGLFAFESDLQVREIPTFATYGCGWEIGLGALAASKALQPDAGAFDHIRRAMTVTEDWCVGVYRPFFVARVPLRIAGVENTPVSLFELGFNSIGTIE